MNLSAEFQNVLNGSVDSQTVSFVFQTIPAHTARAVSLCKLWFHIQDILLLCVFNWVCIVLAIPSSAALLHHIVLFCIIAWHIGVSYLFLTDVALLIVVALWSWGKHISIHCIHGQHKNGFRLKSNWLKYTIFPRPSFKSCFKKEKKESAGQCRLTLKTWWPHKQDCLCSCASLRWNAVRKFNAVLPDGQEYYTQMSWHASL